MKNKIKKSLALILTFALLAGTLSACSSNSSDNAAQGEKQTVKVGVMTPLSGQNARFGEVYKASIEAAMRVVEEDNLLEHYTLEFEYVDDKADTASAVTAATYVLDNYGAHVSIGHMLTTMILVSGQYFEDAQVPLLGIVSGPASVEQGWDYLCIETGTDLSQADTLLEFLIEEKNFEKIGLIHINTEGGMSAADRIEYQLENKYGLQLLTRDAMTNDDMDFTAQVLKMKDADVETVIFWGLNQANANICMKQIEQLWGRVPEDIFFTGGTSLAQNQMLETWSEEDIQGIVFPVGYIPDDSNPAIVKFIEYFSEADPLGQDPADVPARVYDAVFHIVTALNDLGEYDVNADDFTVKLNTALRNAKFTGVQGEFDFSANTNGVGFDRVNVGEWGPDYSQSKIYPN